MIALPENVVPGKTVLELSHLSEHAAELKTTALQILDNLDSPERSRITLDDVRRTKEIFKATASNGDGIITPEAIQDVQLKKVAQEILDVFEAAMDMSGERGVDLVAIDRFAEARKKALAWHERGQAVAKWGEGSRELAQIVEEVTQKVDEYFLECRLVAAQPG